MNKTHTCQGCGAALPGTSGGENYCAACILRQGLLSTEDSIPRAPMREGPPPIFGSYELLEEIGRGGMGVVYKARQRSLKRTVAIKLLVSGAYSSESLLRRFQIEAESAASLQHPGIVAIFEFGENESQPFYTMEFVEGKNLSEVCAGRPMAPSRAATYVRAIAEAVQYAHTRGILHRDLKPSNVLIDLNDRPRITDFGLAKQLHGESDVSVAGQMLGSPNYAPPEQAAGKEVGVTSDVYSLGGLLYNLLTGRPPFLASTVQETLRLVYETDPISPRALNPDVPQDLDTICLKCLEKDPSRRYASAQALADELIRFLKGEPILARPVSKVEQGWRWCRRHPAIASLAATVVAALTATSAIFYSSTRRVEHARALEHAALDDAEVNLYAANMQLTSRGVQMGGTDPEAVANSLAATRPKPGGSDLRGFEWRHFWYLNRADSLATLKGHANVVKQAFFSPNGARIATLSQDGVMKVWDAGSMKELQSLDDVASAGGFTSDGAQLLFSRPDNALWRLDVATGKAAKAREAEGRLIAALPDGRHAVLFGPDRLPVQRTIDEPAPSGAIPDVPVDVCSAVSADGRLAAVCGRIYPAILVIDLATHRQVAAMVDPRPVIALALSPDGSQLASAGFDGVVKVWDVEHGSLVTDFKAFLDPVFGLAYSADGRSLAAGGNNRIVGIWNTTSWREEETLRGHLNTILCVAFSPDGQRLVSGAQDRLAMVWPSHANHLPEEMPHLLRGPEWIDRTPGIAFSPDSRLFAGTAADGTIKVWRTDTIETTASFDMNARTVAFSPDGKSILGEGYDGIVRRWKLDGQNPEQMVRPKATIANWQVDPLTPLERVAMVADQPETRAICHTCEITSSRDGINGGAILTTPTIAMSPDGQTMYVGLPHGDVEIWDVATRKRRLAFQAHQLNVTAISASPDGHYLATGSMDNSTSVWEAATGRNLATFHFHNRPVWAVAFSPDGRTLAAGSCDKEIILCSVPLLRHVAGLSLYTGIPKDYTQEVRLLRFSPDGNILAVGLGDGSVRFFRAAPFSVTDADKHETAAQPEF
jgi:eukaryotic-like serine/threonine-protein kinase